MSATLPPLDFLGLVPSSYVDAGTREVVDRALSLARRRLGLPCIDVRWFAGRYAPGFVDPAHPTVVWLSSSLEGYDPRQVAEITAHEASHCADALRGRGRDDLSRRLGEHRALAFGQELADAIGVTPGLPGVTSTPPLPGRIRVTTALP